MSEKRSSLPAYLRLPDGLRFSGSAEIDEDGRLLFNPKQAISTLPPDGLPVQLIIAGLPDNEEVQLSVEGSIGAASARAVQIDPDGALPDPLVEALDPDSIIWLPPEEESRQLLETMRQDGSAALIKGMRRFVIDLGDQLFDLSTSSRYGMSGQHAHYDALNMLKRHSDEFVEKFGRGVSESFDKMEKGVEGQNFVDLEAASARSLDLVALDEMNQKLAVDKIVSSLIDAHRVDLECLTIRAALIADVEPRRARTPFHPAYVAQAFVDALEDITDEAVVVQDTLTFFGSNFAPLLGDLYPKLNKIFIDAGIETDLEQDIRENGSLLNPVEKRIIKSTTRSKPAEEEPPKPAPPSGSDAPKTATDGDRERVETPPASKPPEDSPPETASEPEAPQDPDPRERTRPAAAGKGPSSRHDAMYEAVVNALDTSRSRAVEPAAAVDSAGDAAGTDGASDRGPGVSGTAAPSGPARGPSAPVSAGGDGTAGGGVSATIDQGQIISALQALQAQPTAIQSLDELIPLESLVREQEGGAAELDRDGANRLNFVDNVFRTLNNNFEVSADMAPSLARLRVPLARLSIQEPRFFTQPDHPAHQMLDKLSILASADHTVHRALKSKVSEVIDRVATEYEDDNQVFAEAQADLDGLLSQKDKAQNRNIERVIRGLEGQEKLIRAQRRVEHLLENKLPEDHVPEALQALLDSGWRSALVQLALREGEDSVHWQEEAALMESLVKDLDQSETGTLPEREMKEMQLRLRALHKRLNLSNPGSIAHESALRDIQSVLQGQAPVVRTAYAPPPMAPRAPEPQRVEQLPRLRRWLQRVSDLEPGAHLRYRDKDGQRRRMKLVWVSEDRERFAFVNERGQKVAELTAVQLARQLSRGARPPSTVDNMSVVEQSVYETLEEAQKTLSFDRSRDSLTQLINGESLLQQLKRVMRHAQARDSEHAFLLLDIDNFALVNDVFDETSGDQVISEFARLLGQLNDRRALTARMEEDEFGILLTYCSADEARKVADKVRRDIAQSSVTIGEEAVSFTVSIGVAPVTQAAHGTEIIVDQARSALGTAKSQGRDQVVVFDIDQQEIVEYRREREASRKQLDDAMSTDRLVLRAQPIVKSAVDGNEGASHHYEILLSLREDDGELVSPQDFIMSAERFGFVTLVDRWVLSETFAWISHLVDSQKEVPELSINLSGTSITDNDFLDYVLEQISEYGVGTSRLCFEITETGAIDNLPRAADFVRTLKNIGCKFSLDDFGTGLASHKYLKELPVDYVKIDGTFITDIDKNETDYAMTKSINDLAHFLGQRTIAECVENMEVVPALREIGIDYLQGWGIGKPRVLSEITEDLADLET